MARKHLMKDPTPLTFKEEAWNASLHGICVVALITSLPFLAIYRYQQGSWMDVWGLVIYILCMICMFAFSTLYHIMPYHTPWKTITRKLDHCAIVLAIAGTYTPCCLSLLGKEGLWLLGAEWLLAAIGIVVKIFSSYSHPVFSLSLYLGMGWLALLFLPALIEHASGPFLLWMVAGGICYTIGVYFYAVPKKYYHVIWHVWILLASLCQFIAVIFYI